VTKTAAETVTGAMERARGRSALVHWIGRSAGGFACYVVCSAESVDSAYGVTFKAGEYRCTCPAGDVGRRCWHQAAVYAVRATRHAWGLAADGPSAERERAEAVAVAA
jgi:hypothetical protein